MTTTAAKWSERVRDWRASGKTAEEFATGRDYEPTTLRYWSSRLKTEAAARSVTTMARVVRKPSRESRDDLDGRGLEVVMGAVRVVVHRGFDAELLREVAAALGATR